MTHNIVPVEGDLGELLNNTLSNPFRGRYVTVDGVVLPEYYTRFAEAIENFEVRDDDIWVCSYPKTGTTWTQEMVWCILNDMNSKEAKVPLTKRFPYLELSAFVGNTDILDKQNVQMEFPDYMIDSVRCVRDLPSPRFIKTHLPFHLLPRQLRNGETKAKIVYVIRNAKDTCISYYHHVKLLDGFRGSFEDMCDLFVGDTVNYAPFWGHALGYWKKRIYGNLLFLKYEDMKKDLPRVIKNTATFLGESLTTDRLSILTEHLSFASMKANPAVNNEDLVAGALALRATEDGGEFMRNGNADQWKTAMTPEIIQRFDDWTRECLKGTHLSY